MPFLFQYLFKLSLTLAVLYIFYYALLRKLTFYTWNRFYLLCYSLLSFLIPFVNITPWIRDQPVGTGSFITRINIIGRLPVVSAVPAEQAAMQVSPYNVLLFIFAVGAACMLVKLLLQLWSIQSIKRKAILIQTGDIRLYDVDGPVGPFSFARSIFVNTRRYSEEDLQQIVRHEFVHVKQKHTADLLVGELLCIVNWYNPFAWLIKRAIRQNLEFIADHSVLQTGLDAKQYQYLLLQVTGLPYYSVSNSFNISSLKKRIVMMNKLKSARAHLLRFLFVLPLLAVLLLAFRKQQAGKQNALLLQKPAHDTIPPKPPVPPAVGKKRVEEVHMRPAPPPPLPQGVNSIVISNKATVVLKNGKKEEYNLDDWQEKAAYEKKYGRLPPPAPVPPDIFVVGKEIKKVPGIPVPPEPPVIIDTVDVDLDSLIIKPVVYITAPQELLYVVDGKVLPNEAALSMIDNLVIEHVEDLEGKKATDLYGDKGANGVIIITTGSNSTKALKRDESERKMMELFNKALIIINGKESSKSDVIRMLSHSPNSISLYTSDRADKKYGDKGKNGVIILTLNQ